MAKRSPFTAAINLLKQFLIHLFTHSPIHPLTHDEIIFEIPEEKANDAAVILERTMIEAGKAYLSRVPVEVEVTIGETWAEK